VCNAFKVPSFLGQAHLRGKTHNWTNGIPLEDLMIEHSKIHSNYSFKKKAIRAGIFANECSECKMEAIWNKKPLSLHLDHINGINDDYRKENLRLLCPNCHSQTSTYCGRNKKHKDTTVIVDGIEHSLSKQKPKKIVRCKDCNIIISNEAIRCKACAGFHKSNNKTI
jgi:Zn finger protein HypA/HybF involved in hydrogenase expression